MGYAAIVLAGGTARRLGGVSKPLLDVGGQPIIVRVLSAVRGATSRIVVGPPELERIVERLPNTVLTREDPPLSGPLAGVAAGLAAYKGRVAEVCVLAGDMPMITVSTISELGVALERDAAAAVAVAVDPGGHRQPLLARWRVPALRSTLQRLGDVANRPLRDLYADVPIVEVQVTQDAHLDCDTETELDVARGLLTGRRAGRRYVDL